MPQLGYWSIAACSQRPSTSLACYDSSFAGGLVEAATLLSVNQEECLVFVAYDTPAPFPLYETRPLLASFALAFVLGKEALPTSVSQLDITLFSEPMKQQPTTKLHPSLEPIRLGNPAARGLPLLQLLATNLATSVNLDFLDNLQLRIDHQPWPPYPN